MICILEVEFDFLSILLLYRFDFICLNDPQLIQFQYRFLCLKIVTKLNSSVVGAFIALSNPMSESNESKLTADTTATGTTK